MSNYNFCKKTLTFCFLFCACYIPAFSQDDETCCYASEVIAYDPGFVLGDVPFDPQRTDPGKALGKPEGNNTNNFVSLGFGGELILSFGKPVKNGDGDDIKIFETSFGRSGQPCQNWPEQVELFVSQDNESWISVGIGCRTATFSIPEELPWIQYLKLKDVSDPTDFLMGDEGYDVDGVESLHGYFDFMPTLPTIKCIQQTDGNIYTAFLGYDNQNEIPVEIPVGERNKFSPGAADAGQPETFQAGAHENVFTFLFEYGNQYYWTITGPDSTTHSIQICKNAPVCPVEMPTAVISGGGELCDPLESATVAVELTGEAPWTVVYRNAEGDETSVTDIQESPYTFETSEITTFSLVSVSDASGNGAVSGSASVSLASKPTAALSGGGEVCQGDEMELTIELSGEAPWTVVYQNGDGQPFTLEDINTPVYSFFVQNASTYSLISVTDANCTGDVAGTATVEFPETPTASVSVGDDHVICGEGDAAQLDLFLTGEAPFQVVYTNGSQNFSLNDITEASMTIEVSEAGVYELVSVEDANCAGEVSGQATIEEPTLPEISFTFDKEDVCQNGMPIDLTAQPAGGIFQGPGVSGNTFDPAAVDAGVHTIVYTYENESGCSVQASREITVRSIPTATLSGQGTLCNDGDQVYLNVDLTGEGPWSLTYSNGVQEFTLNNITEDHFSIGVKKGGTYELISVSDSYCDGTVSGSASVTDLTEPLSIDFDIPAETCVDEPAPLKVSFSGEGLTWEWSTTGLGTITDPSSQVTEYKPADGETGEITFTVKLSNACAALEETFTLTIREPVNAEFTTSGELKTFVDVEFIPENQNGDSYTWIFDDGESSAEKSPDHAYVEAGDYMVSLTVEEDGCESTVEKSIHIAEEKIIYVPNVFSPSASDPENRVVKVYGRGISPDGFLFRIVNRWNNVMFETTDLNIAQNSGWDGRAKGNGEMQAQGVYTFVLRGKFLDGETFKEAGTITLMR